jgi:inner membrane protein
MPSAFGHAVAAVALTNVGRPLPTPARLWGLAIFCAVLPDADVLAFAFGIPYAHTFGHRGFSHSIACGVLVCAILTALFFREEHGRMRAFLVLLAAMVSHGVLDAMTNGGLGVAFLAPFSGERFFLPWRPIVVSPIGMRRFFTDRGLAVLGNELVWVWLPSLTILGASWLFRRRRD